MQYSNNSNRFINAKIMLTFKSAELDFEMRLVQATVDICGSIRGSAIHKLTCL